MKTLFTMLFCCISVAVLGQSNGIELNDLYIPNSPGLILAGKSPSSVDKPVTPRGFAISLLNLGEGGAMEVTPFWLSHRPNYTFENSIRNRWPIFETLNFSVSSYRTENVFTFAPGLRAQLFRLYSRQTIDQLMALKAQLITAAIADTPNFAAIDSLKKELDKTRKAGSFTVEVAGAIAGSSTNTLLHDLNFNKSGIWTNLKWSPGKLPVSVIALGRYSWNQNKTTSGKDTTFLDFGASLNFAKGRFDLSVEYVNRRDLTSDNNFHRVGFLANFAVTENIILVASTGKDLTEQNKLTTLFGVKFGLARNKAGN